VPHRAVRGHKRAPSPTFATPIAKWVGSFSGPDGARGIACHCFRGFAVALQSWFQTARFLNRAPYSGSRFHP
jgi:hypothetical protein